MEAKLLASVFSFLSIFLAIYAQSSGGYTESNDGDSAIDYETAIYYGDKFVNIGDKFLIACIVPISNPIFWLKDDEPITLHNLRHGRDEHSYTLSEHAIEGENHKIEAHLSVRHALKVHEGKYQCNDLHTNYHMLFVRSPVIVPKPRTKSPFIITASEPRETSRETLYEPVSVPKLTTSSSADAEMAENVFTDSWDPVTALLPGMPAQTGGATTGSNTAHRAYHHYDYEQPHKEHPDRLHGHRKLIYINATNFDGSPRPVGSAVSSGQPLRLNFAHMPPTQKYSGEFTSPAGDHERANSHAKHHSKQHHLLPPMHSSAAAVVTTYYTSAPANSAGTEIADDNYDEAAYSQYHTHQQQRQRGMPTTPIAYPTTFTPFQQKVQTYHTPLRENQLQELPHYVAVGTAVGEIPIPVPPLSHAARPTGIHIMPPKMATTIATALLPTKEQDFLVPNYDHAQHQYKFFEIRTPLVLSCNITKDGAYELTWEKNGTDVSKVKELEGRYKIIAAERKFIIDRTNINDDGLYSCLANNQKKDIYAIAHIAVRVPSNTGVVEGEKLSIVCTVVGTDPQLSWTIGNLTITNSTERYILKSDDNQVQNAILTMENASLDDRGDYKCIGRNAATEYGNVAEASDVSYVRVKGKLAALWPFLGICAEVLILCAIILIYEKRRNKNEPEESDTDPQEQKKRRRNYD